MGNGKNFQKITAMSLLQASDFTKKPVNIPMPDSTEYVSERFIWQVVFEPDENEPGDPLIKLELHYKERAQLNDLPDGLDRLFRDFIEQGIVDYGGRRGRISFIDGRSIEQDAHVPEFFSLQPLFRPQDIDNPRSMRQRLANAEVGLHHDPDFIFTRWSKLLEASKTEQLVQDPYTKGMPVERARWYQAVEREGGKELFLARLPNPDPNNENLRGAMPDQMFVKRPDWYEQGGVIVRLTSRVYQNLLDIIPLMIEDGDNFTQAFYVEPPEEDEEEFNGVSALYDEIVERLRSGDVPDDWLEDQLEQLTDEFLNLKKALIKPSRD